MQFRFSEPLKLAKLRSDLESAVLEINVRNVGGLTSRAEQILRDFGQELFDSIFVNVTSISKIYEQSKNKHLRIKLRITSPDLAALPWEYLYEEDDVIGYLSLKRPFVRYLETEGAAGSMGVKGPLRILGMISAPDNEEWPRLEVAKERERINKGIDKLQKEGRVVFQWVSGRTPKDLMEKLQEGDWHIFHFIGHGGVEPRSQSGAAGNSFDQSGFIVMVDEDGKPVKKFARDLAIMLDDARDSLRLVVLNCCESARINVGEKFCNPAIGLMKGGWLPAVVAMQFRSAMAPPSTCRKVFTGRLQIILLFLMTPSRPPADLSSRCSRESSSAFRCCTCAQRTEKYSTSTIRRPANLEPLVCPAKRKKSCSDSGGYSWSLPLLPRFWSKSWSNWRAAAESRRRIER